MNWTAEQIKRLREDAWLTQLQFSGLLGINVVVLSAIEHGEVTPGEALHKTISKLAGSLDLRKPSIWTGDRVKAARKAVGLTRKELASRLNISQSGLRDIEIGKRVVYQNTYESKLLDRVLVKS